MKIVELIGGATNLKLRATGGEQGPGHRGKKNFCARAKCQPLFSYCVHQKNVAGSRGKAPGQEVRGEAETLLAFKRAMEAAKLVVFF